MLVLKFFVISTLQSVHAIVHIVALIEAPNLADGVK